MRLKKPLKTVNILCITNVSVQEERSAAQCGADAVKARSPSFTYRSYMKEA